MKKIKRHAWSGLRHEKENYTGENKGTHEKPKKGKKNKGHTSLVENRTHPHQCGTFHCVA
jgi:hypothetical protein